MRFCPNCANMLRITTSNDDAGSIFYFCRKCNVTEAIGPHTIPVLREYAIRPDVDVRMHVNKYTKLDPTLKHRHDIDCPNPSCSSHESASLRDVVFIRYDETNMKYAGLCVVCDFAWRSS